MVVTLQDALLRELTSALDQGGPDLRDQFVPVRHLRWCTKVKCGHWRTG